MFNGDFNWFNASPEQLLEVNERVLAHRAMLGNVEYEIANAVAGAGCGCAYPDSVDQGVVDRSNRIMSKLQVAARDLDALRDQLRNLPRWRCLVFGGLKIAVLHGDPESLAGWGLSRESLLTDEGQAQLHQWLAAMDADAILCSHTCLPLLWQADVAGRLRTVINNGSAGMGNLQADPRGLMIRLSHSPDQAAIESLNHAGVSLSLQPVEFDQASWINNFDQLWPPGSEAAVSYRERIRTGTNLPCGELRIR